MNNMIRHALQYQSSYQLITVVTNISTRGDLGIYNATLAGVLYVAPHLLIQPLTTSREGAILSIRTICLPVLDLTDLCNCVWQTVICIVD